jgi:hypothetical protein
VNDAQLVVLARVKENSLKNISHQSSFETHAVLLITRVIKGSVNVHELPIVIAYDAIPVPQSVINKSPSFGADGDHDFPFLSPYSYNYSEPIPLYEFNADGPTPKVIDDVRKENFWFLRPYQSMTGSKTDPGTLGLLDFRDVQPLSKETDFKRLIK